MEKLFFRECPWLAETQPLTGKGLNSSKKMLIILIGGYFRKYEKASDSRISSVEYCCKCTKLVNRLGGWSTVLFGWRQQRILF